MKVKAKNHVEVRIMGVARSGDTVEGPWRTGVTEFTFPGLENKFYYGKNAEGKLVYLPASEVGGEDKETLDILENIGELGK